MLTTTKGIKVLNDTKMSARNCHALSLSDTSLCLIKISCKTRTSQKYNFQKQKPQIKKKNTSKNGVPKLKYLNIVNAVSQTEKVSPQKMTLTSVTTTALTKATHSSILIKRSNLNISRAPSAAW